MQQVLLGVVPEQQVSVVYWVGAAPHLDWHIGLAAGCTGLQGAHLYMA